jgi:hypothetical protein
MVFSLLEEGLREVIEIDSHPPQSSLKGGRYN